MDDGLDPLRTKIQQVVIDNFLNIALHENGYTEVFANTPEQVAEDLIKYAPGLENATVEALSPLVQNWQERHAGS